MITRIFDRSISIFSAMTLLAVGMIGCSDKIDVSGPGVTSAVKGSIIINRCTGEAPEPCSMLIIDSTGNPRELSRGIVGATIAGRFIYSDSNGLYVSNNDGQGVQKVVSTETYPARLYPPIVSHDGSTVAYITIGNFDGTKFETSLRVVGIDGKNDVLISESPDYQTLPTLSPDGKQIAYFRNKGDNGTGGECELVVASVDGSKEVVIRSGIVVSSQLYEYTAASWSPRGDRIAYTTRESPGAAASLYIINPDGTSHRVIGDGYWPAWSADGNDLVWTSSQTKKLMYSNNGGVSSARLTTGAEVEGEAQISPDGKSVLYTEWDDADDDLSQGRLMVLDIASGTVTKIADIVYNGFWLR